MIKYGKREFSELKENLSKDCWLQIEQFMGINEEIIKTFTNAETIVLFTNERIIFVRLPLNSQLSFDAKTWSFVHYRNILQYDILTTDKITYGKLELKLTDGNIYTFLIDDFANAIEISKIISKYSRI